MVLAVPVPLLLLGLVIRPAAAAEAASLGTVLGVYLLVVGVLPAFSAVGIAAGQFAGEAERDVLTPLLATPASNLAIFGGKVLGSILPPLLYAALAEVTYLVGLVALFGMDGLGRIAAALLLAAALLVPAVTCFAAVVVSLISSRVRTFNAAQQLGGLVLLPVWSVVFAVAAQLDAWGPAIVLLLAGGLLLLDLGLTIWAAATWRREEVLARR